MTIKWKCDIRWGGTPEPVEVLKETQHFVTVREKCFSIGGPQQYREGRMKKDGVIFDTFEDAKAELVKYAKLRITQAEADWQRAKDRMKKVNDLKKPKDAE